MLQEKERNLELSPRRVGTRNRRPGHTIQFALSAITTRFKNNLLSIKAQFELADQLETDNNMQYKDVLRSQVIFLDSALDFFIHEVTKYGMVQIYQGVWEKTERYDNFTIRLGEISNFLRNPEQENWFLDIVNDAYAEDTFMSANAVIGQLNLIGVKWQNVADRAFYEQGSTTSTKDKFKQTLNTLFRRRNQIAHQADFLHETGEKIDIAHEDVEKYIADIEKIVSAVAAEIDAMNNS